ncbi:MAG: arginine--tRNA ligase [Planctomycetia bacterium]|nr:arginine--tRNA ligase [Planctomycetia bacterium]
MNARRLLRDRLEAALSGWVSPADIATVVEMVIPSQDPRNGDYQINSAMPLGKLLKRPPREVAEEIKAKLDVAEFCDEPSIAGPGFINLKLRDDWLTAQLQIAVRDERLNIAPVAEPKTYVVDFSGPNVAKPMHVGHIRSTAIGDSICRTLNFLWHHAVGDNHIGDWGTQFGMIIYGFRHFRDEAAYKANPVDELSRLYRQVNQLVGYFQGKDELPKLREKLAGTEAMLRVAEATKPTGDKNADKKAAQTLKKAQRDVGEQREAVADLEAKLAQIDADAALAKLAAAHPKIGSAVLEETAKLHSGDAENLRLWQEFMPPCLTTLEETYKRLSVTFDETLGESFYHDQLSDVVEELKRKGIARESDGALCVFFPDQEVPMLIRKKDGAFLYATTDLATIRYRMQRWKPDAMLYVVDHRQSLHFEHLFAAAKLWGFAACDFRHVSFGTVLGKDGRPYKTRSGDAVGLKSLLDEAVDRAHAIVSENDDRKTGGAELSAEDRRRIAEIVGIGALKYADLSQNRTSDYEFSYDKMLAMSGNTATYMQYAYARVRSIFRRGEILVDMLRRSAAGMQLELPAERALAIAILRFEEALETAVADFRPNVLTSYLYDLANHYSTFFEQCPVLKAPTDETKHSRLLLCDLTARTIKLGLTLLNIDVVEQM